MRLQRLKHKLAKILLSCGRGNRQGEHDFNNTAGMVTQLKIESSTVFLIN